jgi:hypothetical protein
VSEGAARRPRQPCAVLGDEKGIAGFTRHAL